MWKIWLACSLFNFLAFTGIFASIGQTFLHIVRPKKYPDKPEWFNPFTDLKKAGCAGELAVVLLITGPIGTLWLCSMWYSDWKFTRKVIKEIKEEIKEKEKEKEEEDDDSKYHIGLD